MANKNQLTAIIGFDKMKSLLSGIWWLIKRG